MWMDRIKNKCLIVYGAGPIGRIAITVLREVLPDFGHRLAGCAVSIIEGVPEKLEGLPVRCIDEYAKDKDNYFFLIAAKEMYVQPIQENLIQRHISDFAVFDYKQYFPYLERKMKDSSRERYEDFKGNEEKNLISEEEYALFLSKQIRSGELSFEVNLADHCNLNCQCCNHFSPLAEKKFLDCVQWEKDLKRITELLPHPVGYVSLMGGEPLLHPQIEQVLQTTRQCLPDSKINLCSNGLLLPEMSNDFWESVRDYHVDLLVTKYPISFDYDICKEIALKYGIKISYGVLPEGIKTTYLMPISDTPKFNPYQMYMKCAHANYCNVLREGRIYNCSFAANVHYYNQYFGKYIPENEDVSLDIYQVQNWMEIEDFLKRPNRMCSHCDICHYEYNIPWATSKRNVKEWTGGI